MKIVQSLICFCLRQYIGEPAEKVYQFVVDRFSDKSQALPKAVAAANGQTWQALGVALAGNGLLDQLKFHVLNEATENAIRVQVEPFLRACAIEFNQHHEDVRKECLAELKRMRQNDALNMSHLPAEELAHKTAEWKRYGQPQDVVNGACVAMDAVADALRQDYPKLSHLLRQRMGEGPPLLAALFAFFLRQEIENKGLAAGLTFDLMRNLYAEQASAFTNLGKVLDKHGKALESIGSKIDVIDNVVRQMYAEVMARLDKLGMQPGVLSAQHSLSIHSEAERNAVRQLLKLFRQLSPEQQQVPALLNTLGKAGVSAGFYPEAKSLFDDATHYAIGDADSAESQFNAYRTAVEQRNWDGALAAIQLAATLDPERFTFFPAYKYKPQRILGAGGFGTAFLCHDEIFDQPVVVKTLHADAMELSIKEVFNEAQVLHRLSDPAIIAVRDGDFADPKEKRRPYIVMEYFPGITLRAYVQKHGELTREQYLEVAQQIVSGMMAAHRQGVWHRDLKPDNILVLREGERLFVKIIDFGLAMRRQVVETSAAQTGAAQTVHGGSAVGTLAYSAPEQMGRIPGSKPGAYSDVFAFGKTSMFALFGVESPGSPTRSQWASIRDNKLADLLEKCSQYNPKDRYADFEQVARDLPPPLPPPPIKPCRFGWRELMMKADSAKKKLIGNRTEGLNEFDRLLADCPNDGMLYFKRGEAFEELGKQSLAVADYRLAVADYRNAQKLFPMDTWKKKAEQGANRAEQAANRLESLGPPS